MNEPAARPLLLVVAGLLVDAQGQVLIARRPEGKAMAGLWEFPGGKVHEGESPEAALQRELAEELAIGVMSEAMTPFSFASHVYEAFHLLMPVFRIERWEGEVRAREHAALAWVAPGDLSRHAMPPADLPLIPTIIAHLAPPRLREAG